MARYCKSARSAWNPNTRAIPSRIMDSRPSSRRRETAATMATATRDATAAQTATLNWELGMIVHPKTIEAAAPKAAAAEIPNVKGSASGLSRMVCMCAPASERHTPMSTAITDDGMRNCLSLIHI